MNETILMQNMSQEQRMYFLNEMNARRKSVGTFAILALLLGGLGIHLFYVGKTVRGLLHLLFCWTFIPAIVALVDAIRSKDIVDRINQGIATEIAAKLAMLQTHS